MTSFFSAEGGPIWIKFRRLVQNYMSTCGDVVKIETRCRIPIWWTFGRIQWHVIPEPRITLQGAATWWMHCHDSRATCHIAGCSHLAKSMSRSFHVAGRKNSIRHIENRFSPYFLKLRISVLEFPLIYFLYYWKVGWHRKLHQLCYLSMLFDHRCL